MMTRWFLERLESLIVNGNLKEAIREMDRVEVRFELPSQERCWAALRASLVTAESFEGNRRQYLIDIAVNNIKRLKQWTSLR